MFRSTCRVVALLAFLVVPAFGELGVHNTYRFANEPSIRTMDYSTDSNELAVSIDGKVEIFEVSTGSKRKTLDIRPFSMSYSRDGSRLIGLSERRSTVTDLTTGAIRNFSFSKPKHGELGIEFEKTNGKLLVKAVWKDGPAERYGKINVGDELVGATSTRGGSCVNVIGKELAEVKQYTSGPTGVLVRLKLLPLGSFDVDDAVEHTLRRQSAQPHGATWKFEPEASIEIKENVAHCMYEKRHAFCNAGDGSIMARIQTVDVGMAGIIAISSDQKKFAILAKRLDGKGKAVEVFNLATEERIATLPFEANSYLEMSFNLKGDQIIVGTSNSFEVGEIEKQRFVRSILINKPVAKKQRSEESLSPGAFALRGARQLAATGGDDDGIALGEMDVSSRNMIGLMTTSGAVSLWDLESGKMLCNVPSGKVKRTLSGYGRSSDKRDLKFSPDGNWLSFFVGSMLHTVDISKVEAASDEAP